MEAVKIRGKMKDYPWGSRTYIQQLTGLGDEGLPIGEYWMGVHPNAPSTVPSENDRLLSEYMSEHRGSLGTLTSLPFLFKVMAIEKPLSIQCHPSKEQAVAGYAAEADRRTKVPPALWNYQDDNQKAEMLCALTPLTALCGFRTWRDIKGDLQALIPVGWKRHFSHCTNQPNPILAFFHTLYRLESVELQACIAELRTSLVGQPDIPRGDFLSAGQIALDCMADWPGDPGVFGPFFLNVVALAPGEAIYLQPRIVHAYVKGNGIELMNNSDNVLRAGLTAKHMDVDELERVMLCSEQPVVKLKTTSEGILRTFVTESPDFSLSVCTHGCATLAGQCPSIVLCMEGSAKLVHDGQSLQLERGECCFSGVTSHPYRLEVVGQAFIASVP